MTSATSASQSDGAHVLAKQVRAVVGSRLDVLVANAGVGSPATAAKSTVAPSSEVRSRRQLAIRDGQFRSNIQPIRVDFR
jgi:hypothetical protein